HSHILPLRRLRRIDLDQVFWCPRLAAYRGPSRNNPVVLSCATATASNSLMFISRMSRGGEEKGRQTRRPQSWSGIKLEEHVGRSMLFDLDQKSLLFHHFRYLRHRREPAVWSQPVNDPGQNLRQLFGELILGDARHLRQCLDDVRAKRRTKL